MTMLLVAYLKRYKEPVSLKGKCIWEGTQWAIMFLLVYQGIFHFGKLDAQHSMKQDYLLRTEQWDLVISEFNHDVLSKRRMCGFKLSFWHIKASFSERLLDYPQHGIETIDATLGSVDLYSTTA